MYECVQQKKFKHADEWFQWLMLSVESMWKVEQTPDVDHRIEEKREQSYIFGEEKKLHTQKGTGEVDFVAGTTHIWP